MKEFVDTIVEIYENGGEFSEWAENIVGKGEIACNPFPTMFSADLYCRHVKSRACLGNG